MVEISPVGLATTALVANQISLLAVFKEKLCRPFCVGSTVKPQVSVVFTNETPVFTGSTVFVPITAVVTVVTPGVGCRATTQLFTEKFMVAFQGQTAAPTAVTIAEAGMYSYGSKVVCGKAHSYTINSSITVTIA